jgi:hypothetical protein
VSAEEYSTLGVIANGRLQVQDRTSFDRAMARFPDGLVTVEIKTESQEAMKSRQQEKGFHAMITPWAKEEGHLIEDLKRDLLREIFGTREHVDRFTGEVVLLLREPHTSKLSRKKYNELIERTLEIAAECGHVLVAPSEWRARKRAA